MVATRRSGASEPLERLDTPPKRNQQAEPAAASTKRHHEEDAQQQDDASPSKRARTQPTTPAQMDDPYFMFPKRLADQDAPMSEPPKSLAETFQRNRRLRNLNKRNGRFGSVPRQNRLVKLDDDNPFGIETFSPQELAVLKAQRQQVKVSPDREERDDRSAAPEPETPKKGLFGSLRETGNALFGRVLSPFARSQTPQSATLPAPRTEPKKRTPIWDVQYPQFEQLQDENQPPQAEEREESEADRKRREFEAKHGRTNRRFDHLHTTPIEGDAESLPYPIKESTSKQPPQVTRDTSSALDEFTKRRQKRREQLLGKQFDQQPPKQAPLFGPNSHYARGTKNPIYEQFFNGGEHPAMRNTTGQKRKLNEAMPDETILPEKRQPNRFQSTVEDDEDANESEEEAPSTPLAKKQKTTAAAQTPRSALKIPGSIGRSGRSARFNDNPIMSVKRMSPVAGSAPAGSVSPDNLFGRFSENVEMSGLDDSPSSTGTFTPSPNTRKNTVNNTGKKRDADVYNAPNHPGTKLTKDLNQYPKIEFKWHNEHDPNWRPSLANPSPGTWRVPTDDDEGLLEEALREFERENTTTPEPSAIPDPPASPRPAHAGLPKQSSSTTPSTAMSPNSAQTSSNLEAANLERHRAAATKTKPRKSSKLSEMTSARSRSPSPPGLDVDTSTSPDEHSFSDNSAKTPSPTDDRPSSQGGLWTWTDETNEYLSADPRFPDFAYNPQNELIPSFAIKSSSGAYDNSIVGPDNMTEKSRQTHYTTTKYNDTWAEQEFPFDAPQTYEEAAVGSKYIHDLIRKNDERYPDVVKRVDDRFAEEWQAHQDAIDEAVRQKRELKATYPDRDGVEMADVPDDEL